MSRQDIFIFDNLNEGASLFNNKKASEYFNRNVYITENEGHKTDERQWKYYISFGKNANNFTAFGGVGADGHGTTFCNAPRLVDLQKTEDGKYKLIISDTLNVVVRKIGKYKDDYMKEDGFESLEDGTEKKIYSYSGGY